MGLFNKKNKAAEVKKAPEAEVATGSKPKKNDLLNILNESVWERTLEDLKKNQFFTIKSDDGENKYVGLMFDTNDVGGFTSKEAKNDESKGSVIEAIKMGKINTFIRPEMLMDDCFVIIPDQKTVAALKDYPMFESVKFSVCTIDDQGQVLVETVDNTDDGDEIKVGIEDVAKVYDNKISVEDLIPYMSSSKDGLTDPMSLDGEDVEPVDDDAEEDIEEIPDDDVEDISDDEMEALGETSGPDEEEPVAAAPAPAPVDTWTCKVCGSTGNTGKFCQSCGARQGAEPQEEQPVSDASDDYESESYDEGAYEDEEYEDITQEVVDDFVTRTFYSDDLGLEISTEPFDLQFVRGNPYIPFKEERGDGWLNGYVSNLAKDANTAMERKHEENLFRLREQYMRKMAACCDQIVAELDYTDQKTKYGKIYAMLEATRQDRIDHLDESVAIKRNQLEEAWQKSLNEVGQKAAEEAKGLHRSRYGRSHENDMASVEARELDEIERLFNDDVRRMNDERRADASKLLDQAITNVLDDLRENYMGKALVDEKKQYGAYQRQIASFIDNNRKDEKARINALIEQQNRTNEVEAVRNECRAQIDSLTSDLEARKQLLDEQVKDLEQKHADALDKHDEENAKKVEAEIVKQNELKAEIEHLTEKYEALGESKEREYEARIASFEKERASWQAQTDSLIASHKRSNLISTVLIVAILVAALGIGFIIGTLLNVRKTSNIEQDAARIAASADGN